MRLFRVVLVYLLSFVVSSFSQNSQKPKNIILLIGDGMGTNYVSAAVLNLPNSPFRRFTNIGFSITCSADKLITDSAAGATALL